MSRGGQPTRRVTASAQRPEILIFVEGLETEERYLNYWARLHRHRVLVRIDQFRGAPLSLVKRAVSAVERGAREAKRGRGKAYDEVWCVFDVDEHPNLDTAKALAAQHGIHLAISNPCLELWFLLHFTDRSAYLDRHAAQRLARGHLNCGKVLTEAALESMAARYDEAVRRAVRLDEKHAGDGSAAGANPSCGLWPLVNRIRGV